MTSEAVRVVAVADSDSYLKWGAATLDGLPAGWLREQWLVTSPIMPSAGQIAAATERPVRVRPLLRLVAELTRRPPDVVLLACTGPVVQALVAVLSRTLPPRRRPVLVTGLPGISIPATARAIAFRRGADLFVLHSRREVAAFAALAAALGADQRFVLARLPFLAGPGGEVDQVDQVGQGGPGPRIEPDGPRRDVVFAAQAKVPPEPEQRRAVLLALARLAEQPGGLHGVVKVRAAAGEQQTHRELWSYPELWQQLVDEGRVRPDQVTFRGGSMQDALAGAAGLATVSSTAALEAIAAGLPLLVLDEFGVSAEMINEVFVGSGCLGSLADLAAGRLHAPDPRWLEENYFHPGPDAGWVDALVPLVARRRAGDLAPVTLGSGGGRPTLRSAVRLLLPAPAVRVIRVGLRRVRQVRRAYRRRRGLPDLGRPDRVRSAPGQHPLADLADGPGSG
ncbi:hypothetical protein FHX74_003154 [Friedmanniella endophytica]|uniref:Uncharacterized protein n=1 Tax=Microlunatus kandeliicorticis TaxID=1759536 RepID=A0A7W3IUJ0_9ACTN|nr:DUF6716 putative glycosyltransferase [Microlunatus kandeliicorticis]MBA8795518.1 hypothetical protein [Microlunatus kandeliicorticis]